MNWNRCEDTLACLSSLTKLDYPNLRLLLVDNGSSDGTPQLVAQKNPTVEVIVNESNLGFAAGCNVGLRHALEQGADYVFLLNNDTLVDPAALNHLIFLAGPDVGMVAPKIYNASNPAHIWSVGGMCHPLTLEKTGDGRGQVDKGQWGEVLERDYFVGCALLLSRRLLTEVGLFDERFFMYYEDSDLSLRTRQAGFKLLLSPQAWVWHKVAVSSGGSDSLNERYWMGRSSVLFFYKHVRGFRWLIVLPYRAGSAIKTVLRLICEGKGLSARAYLRGLYDGFIEACLPR
ncbi:MAG: glycosyltransferase family 2 protein [Candidatus Aminicenantes bacterium]|nr:glycosyltransferase family 2 protein [Candidatus Aminicenantes bacterium]